MLKKRLIAVLILRAGKVVQSVKFKHTNVIHYDATHVMEAFNKWAVDEIVVLNVSRESSSKTQFAEVIEKISSKCFVPLAVGGWIHDVDYAQTLLRRGADKLVLNTAFSDNPDLIKSLSLKFGRQCIVASIDCKRGSEGESYVAVDRGSRVINVSPLDWAKNAVSLGAGEIFFNSIDHDGARMGYDLVNLEKICSAINIPVIAFGGVFNWEHLLQGINAGAVAVANQFHYTE
ncbi:imidazole glycerol phosphate synthase subunit HisF [Candidatus Methylopumilus universalis]|uniref:imidazole glycerol phosphate synthase subunit HisF n=1 Tax=Candidatus Methylopumilus universalis TaxID=2588536 RepID=UPI00112140C9|nr:HisA/HisF-related TIM barrel protein [Candidatus Methylopumilus universalis]QDC47513.1 imidazole glycerol phosphate synthase subunit HisF [Candidatus Methylopumilus universalis]QDC72046.1 imidazole glycerol phosphate synthase subunit HisF [Candidatus Methylopumilus universalis]